MMRVMPFQDPVPGQENTSEHVDLRVLDSAEAAARANRNGLRRLLILSMPQDIRYLRKNLPGLNAMRLQYAKAPHHSGRENGDIDSELMALILDRSFFIGRPRIGSAEAFEQRIAECKGDLMNVASEVCKLTAGILAAYQRLRKQADGLTQINWLPSVQDIKSQMEGLLYKGFLADTPYDHLQDYPRFLQALETRVQRLPTGAQRDRQRLQEMTELNLDWQSRNARVQETGRDDPRLHEIRWMLEELRISLFAQPQPTAYPISVKRIRKRWKELGL